MIWLTVKVKGYCFYSYRQRGWYQVKSPGRAPLSSSHSRKPPVTAEELPPELFERIWVTDDRKTLSKCGQVCRYWASQCRPRLFKTINLAPPPRVLDFRDPACLFMPYVEGFLPLEYDILSWKFKFPWLHILTQTWGGKSFPVYVEGLRYSGSLPGGLKTIRSVHFSVPRLPLPQLFTRGIRTLELTHVRLGRFEDTTHLVCELPDLEEYRFMRVTRESFPTEPPRRRPRSNRNKLSRFEHSTGYDWKLKIEDKSPCTRAAAVVHLFPSVHDTSSFFSEGEPRASSPSRRPRANGPRGWSYTMIIILKDAAGH